MVTVGTLQNCHIILILFSELPKAVISSNNPSTNRGGKIEIVCTAAGVPSPTVTLKRGKLILVDVMMQFTL